MTARSRASTSKSTPHRATPFRHVASVGRGMLLALAAFGALGTACLAEGVDEESTNRFEPLDGGTTEAGATVDGSPVILRATCDDAGNPDACAAVSRLPDDTNVGRDAGDAFGSNDDGGAPAKDAGSASACGVVNNCRQGTSLGTLSGDDVTGQTTASRRGTKSEWFTVRMKETYEGVVAGPMKFSATLVSPSAANYDLYVYVDTNQDVVECSAVRKQSTNPTGDTDRVELTWGEEYTGNSGDDSRTVMIEVRHVEGACDAANTWSLVVEGYRN
ncbi:MAG: hypothetical protein U0169_14030 [Polyangiaceae bacterium]